MLTDAPVHDTRAADYGDRFADRMVLPTLGVAGATYALTRDPGRLAAIMIVDWATGWSYRRRPPRWRRWRAPRATVSC